MAELNEISFNGGYMMLFAVPTYPTGVKIATFDAGQDPLDFGNVDIATAEMGVNGDMVAYRTPYSISITFNLIPFCAEDKILENIVNADRIQKGKNSAKNNIEMMVNYGNGRVITLTDGTFTNVPLGFGGSSDGRTATRSYTIVFRNSLT